MVGDTAGRPTLRYQLLLRRSSEKTTLITLISGVVGVAAVYLATREPGALSAIAPALIVLGLVLVGAGVRNWELGVKAILVVVILEGAVRKWFLPSASELVYFYKDVLMAATLIGYFRKRSKTPFVIKRRLKLLSITIGVFLIYGLISLGMPGGPHPLVSLLGLKAYCLYMPMAFITVRAFPDKERLIGFLKWYVLIVLPVALIGVIQFLDTGQQSTLNRYAVAEESAARVVDIAKFSTASGSYFVRITGTFSYVTGLSVYLPIMFALLLAMTSLYAKRGGLSRGSKILYYSALAATVVTAFMTGSRGAVLSMVMVALIFYLFTSGRQTIRRVQQLTVMAVILFVAFTSFFPQAYDAFYNRTFGTADRVNEGWERMAGSLSLPINEASYAGMFGYGIGLTQNGVPALMKRLGLADQGNPIPIGYEGEPGRVTLELGVVGFVLHTLLRLILLITVCRLSFALRDRESKILAFAAAAALVMPLLVGGAVSNHTQNVYQWFLVGVVLALYNAERVQLRKAAQAAAILPAPERAPVQVVAST